MFGWLFSTGLNRSDPLRSGFAELLNQPVSAQFILSVLLLVACEKFKPCVRN
jgi:hypothetical protein